MPDLSVVIVNWNTRDLLRDCLNSIYSQTHDLDFDVWVVDNGSEDGSNEMVENEFPSVILLKNSENLGFSKANNQVMRRSTSTYFLLLNSDTRIVGNTLKGLVDHMERNPDAGGAGCKILNDDGSLQLSCGRFPTLWSILFGGEIINNFFRKVFRNKRFFAEYALSDSDHLRYQEVDIIKGCCLVLRKSVLEKIGLLDENYFMYFEEIDLCYRIKQSGMKIIYMPDYDVVHLGGQSTVTAYQSVYRNLYSQEVFFSKNYGAMHAFALRVVVLAGALIRLPVYMTAYLLAGSERKPFFRGRLEVNLYTLRWQVLNFFNLPAKKTETIFS